MLPRQMKFVRLDGTPQANEAVRLIFSGILAQGEAVPVS